MVGALGEGAERAERLHPRRHEHLGALLPDALVADRRGRVRDGQVGHLLDDPLVERCVAVGALPLDVVDHPEAAGGVERARVGDGERGALQHELAVHVRERVLRDELAQRVPQLVDDGRGEPPGGDGEVADPDDLRRHVVDAEGLVVEDAVAEPDGRLDGEGDLLQPLRADGGNEVLGDVVVVVGDQRDVAAEPVAGAALLVAGGADHFQDALAAALAGLGAVEPGALGLDGDAREGVGGDLLGRFRDRIAGDRRRLLRRALRRRWDSRRADRRCFGLRRLAQVEKFRSVVLHHRVDSLAQAREPRCVLRVCARDVELEMDPVDLGLNAISDLDVRISRCGVSALERVEHDNGDAACTRPLFAAP